MRIPLITVHEWRSIAPLLPPTNDPGKARHGDRLYVSAFYYAEATRSSLENLQAAYGNPRLLRTRRQRWERDGVLGKLMEAGGPVIARMKAGYCGLKSARIPISPSRNLEHYAAAARLTPVVARAGFGLAGGVGSKPA